MGETRRYILYSEIQLGENQVDCIYFVSGVCMATPTSVGGDYYKPTEQDQKDWCKNIAKFKTCPRFTGYQEHLRAVGLQK
jgi:hypothetical protein